MPEFEEVSPETNPQHNYVPSTDAKPRSRRRSGGFKKELSPATADSKMGEVDPAEMLQSESLSGSNKTIPPAETIDSTEPTIDAETASTDKIVAAPPPTHCTVTVPGRNWLGRVPIPEVPQVFLVCRQFFPCRPPIRTLAGTPASFS